MKMDDATGTPVEDFQRKDATMKEAGEEEDQRTLERNDGNSDAACSGYDGEMVRWEMFLPRMVVRVLLVEADHCTRQIISALLRKCSYSVIAVSDGLKAWETLKSKSTELDLILTELELPAISGFALLTLIMEHDTCKNIPVIMMSSHSSVGMVFNCMLKGAADFLIKPVRWNELRNLWQHVWRRHASSNSTSNQSSGSVGSLQKNNECLEKLIEAQDASQLKSSLNLRNADVNDESTQIENESAKPNDDDGTGEKSVALVSEVASSRANSYSNTKIHGCSDAVGKPSRAIDLIATFENLEDPANENSCLNSGNSSKFGFYSKLELSLRDFSDSSCKQTSELAQERQILNHSNTSAFSRYSGGNKLVQFATPSLASAKVNNIEWNSQESHKSLGNTHDTSNQENMTTLVMGGQIGPNLSSSQGELLSASDVTSESKGHSNIFTSVLNAQSGVHHPIWNLKRAGPKESSSFPSSTSSQPNPEIHNSEQHNHKSNLDDAGHDSSATNGQSDGNNSLGHDGTKHINSSAHESIGSASDGNATSTLVAKNNLENFNNNIGHHNYDGFRGTNAHRSSQREAALNKFRLKRKVRCYEKKVRYQRRKTLAEQRPRVKGQFVRQAQHDHPVADAGCDP